MTTKFKALLTLTILIVGLAGCQKGGSAGKSTIQVVVPPGSASVSSGRQFSVTIDVKHLPRTFYAAFDVVYDPLKIRFVKADEGRFLSRNGADATFFDAALENGLPGRLAVGITRVAPAGDISGSGTLLSLTFEAIASGNSDIGLSDPKGLRDSNGQEVPVNAWEDGTVAVN